MSITRHLPTHSADAWSAAGERKEARKDKRRRGINPAHRAPGIKFTLGLPTAIERRERERESGSERASGTAAVRVTFTFRDFFYSKATII